MNVLIIGVPTAERDGSVPFGVLYTASSAYRNGHNVRILNLVQEDLKPADIRGIIEDFSPGIIGLGGITSSYKNCKELIGNIKRDFKDIPVVVGGVLASIPELLLKNAGADFIVHGEGEITFPNLIDTIKGRKDISRVKGISFLKGDAVFKTDDQPQIRNLDDIPMPEYGLLNMDKNLEAVEKWVNNYFRYDDGLRREMLERVSGRKMFPIMTSRGCTHKCIFCYRHQKGLRQHSVEYTINMMKHLRDSYGVGVFQINDELTTANKRWVLEFCARIIDERLGVYFIVLSSRVDNVDEEMLFKLKEAGCLLINYGYESASDKVLKEIRKGTTKEQGLRAGILTKKVGLKNVPEIMIGFPSETEETVKETIDFLKELDTIPVSINTPIPFPETPLWEYGVRHNIIKDEEEFILGYKRKMFVNFTKYPDRKVLRFADKVKYDVELHWFKKRRKFSLYMECLFKKIFFMYIKPVFPETTYLAFRKIYRKFFKGR